VISGIIFGYESVAQVAMPLWAIVRDWLLGIFNFEAKFFKIAMEFFTEAAVLVAVFPILDTIIEPYGSVQKVTWSLVIWSEGIAAALLVLAGIMSKAVKGD
jgi:hypothetical protein